jgi:hypothetical protein
MLKKAHHITGPAGLALQGRMDKCTALLDSIKSRTVGVSIN